jgi:hypothetical protein
MTTPQPPVETVEPETIIRAKSPEAIGKVIQRLDAIKASKKDYLAPAKALRFIGSKDDGIHAELDPSGTVGFLPPLQFGIRKRAHIQLAAKLGIHGHYARRMREEAPDLLATNLNYWAEQDNRQVLVRTLDGDIRALLSDRYRMLDSASLFYHGYEAVKEVGGTVVQVDLTDDSFYLRALVPDWEERIERAKGLARAASGEGSMFDGFDDRGGIHYSPVDAPIGERKAGGGNQALRDAGRQNDTFVPGIVISNSETGMGSVRVEPIAFQPYCTNTAIFGESLTRAHLGPKHDLQGLLSDETIDAENKALWLGIRDVIKATFDRDAFKAMVAKFSAADHEQLEEPTKAVEQVVDHYDLSAETKERIYNEMITEGDATVFGLVNALTAIGRDEPNPERAVEFERQGADLLDKGRELVAVRRV